MPHEEPCIVLKRRGLDKDGKKDAGRIVVLREQVFDAIDEYIKAMHTWVRKGCGCIVGPSISMLPSNSCESTARLVLLVARRIQLVTLRRAAGNP